MKKALNEAFDRIVVPDELSDVTLQKMIAENERFNGNEQADILLHKVTRKKPVWQYALPIAACLCLLLVVGVTLTGRNAQLPSISYISDPRLILMNRSGEYANSTAQQIDELAGIHIAEMFPGCDVSEVNLSDFPTAETDAVLFAAALRLRKDDKTMALTISSFEPAMFTQMKKTAPHDLEVGATYVTRGEEGVLYAAWNRNGIYYMLESQDFTTQEFLSFLKDELASGDA